MKTNRVARRILGLPYNLSRSKKKVRFSIITPTESDNLPAELKNATRICLNKISEKCANKRIYMKLTDAYPDYLLVS